LNVLQSDIDKSDSSVKVGGCVHEDMKPAKKLCADVDIKLTESHVFQQSVNTDESVNATSGGNLSLFIDLTASDDNKRLPQSLPSDKSLSSPRHFPTSPPEAQEVCLLGDNSACSTVHQLLSDSCTVSPPESPTSNVSHCPPPQGVNGVCDVSSFKMHYRNAVMKTSCRGDGIMDDLMSEGVLLANGFASLEPEVADVVVNDGNIHNAHD